MKTSSLLIAVAVLVGVMIAVLAVSGGGSSNDDSNLSYNYQIKNTTDSITYGSGSYVFHDDASAGYTYQPVKFIVKNTAYDKGYDVSLSAFAIECSDGNQYSYKYSSTSYYGDKPNTELKLGVGSTTSYTMVFEIPKSVSVTKIVWAGPSYSGIVASYDPELK